nr:hypothetical protein [Streptomyces sp. FT05W]
MTKRPVSVTHGCGVLNRVRSSMDTTTASSCCATFRTACGEAVAGAVTIRPEEWRQET